MLPIGSDLSKPMIKAANKIYGFFAGLVMKATQGKADGKAVREIVMRKRSTR